MGSAGRVVVGQDYGMSWGYNDGGSWSTTAYGSDLADGAWHHVACSRQGSYFYLFQDGVLVSTTSNWLPTTHPPFFIFLRKITNFIKININFNKNEKKIKK